MKNAVNRESGTGKCFEWTTAAVLHGRTDCIVCHGIVTGTGKDVRGVRYPHAWIETVASVEVAKGRSIEVDMVEDETHDMGPLPARLYYKAGQIDPEQVIRYTPEEVAQRAVEHGTYGPWDAPIVSA